MSILFFYLYKFLMAPLAFFLFQILRPLLNTKLKEMTDDKNKGFYFIKKPGAENELALKRPIWIHAASGEIEYARPVIRELKKQYTDVPILVSYTSPSAKKILAQIPEVDIWAAIPWDLEFALSAFLKKWNPRILLFARTDVWPNLAHVAKKHDIPALLFSATFADNSSRLKGPSRFLTQYALNQLSEIHCVSSEDVQNLRDLQITTPTLATGDTRFDQVFHRLENPKILKNELIPSPDEFIFIAGSTWPEDEDVLIPALEKIKNRHIRTILAPHETNQEHLSALENKLSQKGLPFVRYSESKNWPANSVLIIDQVGILAELYTWADLAFVGGSFKKQVHSVMEALAAGLPVMVGPYHRNNREALFYQKKNFSSGMIVQVIHSSDDICVLLTRMKKHQDQIPHIKEEIRSEIGKNKNSTLRVISAVENHAGFSI